MPLAAKFTKEGTVTISGGLSENGKHVYLAVEDTGVGIPKSRLGQIFRDSTADKVVNVFFPLSPSEGNFTCLPRSLTGGLNWSRSTAGEEAGEGPWRSVRHYVRSIIC